MRILAEMIILLSALIFPKSKSSKALLYVADNHEIVFRDW